jgi:hypothetical protein
VTGGALNDASVRNTVGMSAVNPAPTTTPISAAPGGNAYVGPSLTSSLLRLGAALATARR